MSKLVSIKDLQTNTYVRKELDQEHVLVLAQLIEDGIKLPPIQITPDHRVIDGRHRVEAHEMNSLTEIRCEVVEVEDEVDIITRAFRANMGGAKPPTPADIEHTVMLLLDRGQTIKEVAAALRLPPGMTRIYVTQVKSKVNRTKLLQAADSITGGGLTVQKAAEKHGVDPDKLKEMLATRRNRHKPGIAETQRSLTKRYKSVGSSNANLLRKLLEKVEDGDVTIKQAATIIDHLEELQRKSARAVADWKKRLEAVTTKLAKSA